MECLKKNVGLSEGSMRFGLGEIAFDGSNVVFTFLFFLCSAPKTEFYAR